MPLDIFNLIYENKSIDTKRAAWLTFLSVDKPDRIIELIGKYPEYKQMYEDLYNMCRNVEKVMNMYSEELREMDRNTVSLMIDEYQDEIDSLKKSNAEITESLVRAEGDLAKKDEDLAKKDEELIKKEKEIEILKEKLKMIQ